MRILQLCHKPPFPPVDGGTKAMHNITQGLLDEGHEVKVVCISTPKHPLRPEELPVGYRERTEIEGIFVDTSINAVDAFADLVTADNYNVSRFFSPDLDLLLQRMLARRKFDLIHLESLFMAPYIGTLRRYSKAPIVLRSHNLEHVVQQRIASGERNPLKRPYRKLLARQLRNYEHGTLARVNAVAAISPEDAEHFRRIHPRTPVSVVPFGVDPPAQAPPWNEGPLRFFHLGSMDWAPNEEGVRWLLREVWPLLIGRHPEARLHLAGNHMPKDLLKAQLAGVSVEGYVHDAQAWMGERQVMVVPLLSAGGMRVKIIEGMALGRCIISTPRGAEGIACTDGHDVLLAKDAAGFAERMAQVLREPELARRVGREARALVVERYSNARSLERLIELYRKLVPA
ncbi:MAG TPA: glycosyltransferase [Flavobacteriales bacterium]